MQRQKSLEALNRNSVDLPRIYYVHIFGKATIALELTVSETRLSMFGIIGIIILIAGISVDPILKTQN